MWKRKRIDRMKNIRKIFLQFINIDKREWTTGTFSYSSNVTICITTSCQFPVEVLHQTGRARSTDPNNDFSITIPRDNKIRYASIIIIYSPMLDVVLPNICATYLNYRLPMCQLFKFLIRRIYIRSHDDSKGEWYW